MVSKISEFPLVVEVKICRRVWRYKHADFDRGNELLCDMDLVKILTPYDIPYLLPPFCRLDLATSMGELILE